MQEDNMYTRRSTIQSVPLEQEKAANEEFLKVLNEAPLIKAEIELLIADAEALENSVLAISEKALGRDARVVRARSTREPQSSRKYTRVGHKNGGTHRRAPENR